MFQKSVIKKYLNSLNVKIVKDAYAVFKKHFQDPIIQENISNSKEEQYQGEFLIDLFVNVLGYTKNPTPNFNLTTEQKNVKDSKKADGAIIIDGVVKAVIELKGMNTTDLGNVEIQAFGYKDNQRECVYVITSNFEKLRFYIDNAIEHREFNLFSMKEDDFNELYLLLSYESIQKGIPKQIKAESLSQEDVITKKLYNDYSLFKRELYQNLVKLNPQFDALTLFKKSQKLLDRYLFLFFAEDRFLLPPNSVRLILSDWRDLQERDVVIPLYDRFKKYFEYLNSGYKGKRYEIFAYNGGLFKPDEILDNAKIDDEILFKHATKLSEYDFGTNETDKTDESGKAGEVDVSILGHIFENSLNELDEIKAQLAGQVIDKAKTKRKKDGIFYTPKYITKYIVDNTVKRLCEEKKTQLLLVEDDYAADKKRQKETKRKLAEKLTEYRTWLLQLTICDPACGSGAFLNQALDFLISEHRYVDELQAKLFGEALILSDIENSILENNLFGVDLNEESVEIAKLSLWLRTAQPKRKLNDLNNNIKCGNSLIDDPAIAGDKAFNWQNEFPQVFAKGGFDVVIGNPPYVGEKGHSDIFENLKKIIKWNMFYRRRSNTYYFFIKHGIDILKENGIQSLIVPREFTNADWANKVRQEIIENSTIYEIVDFNTLKIFDDAGTTSLILTHKKLKQLNYNLRLKSINDSEAIQNNLFNTNIYRSISINKLATEGYKPWNFNTFEINYSEKIIPLGEAFEISQGLVTGSDKVTNKHIISSLISNEFLGRGIFILSLGIDITIEHNNYFLNIRDKWIPLSEADRAFIKPYFKSEYLYKWNVSPTSFYVLYVGDNNELTNNIKEYLLQFDKILLNRSTINENKVITLSEFKDFTIEDIRLNYSSAGAVQKIMKQKRWYLPLYERATVPFDFTKIVVNTKKMDVFTYSNSSLYSSGGGAGGQNFIYLKRNSDIFTRFNALTTIDDFTMYINALLNSKLLQFYIKNGQFNQLSTSKISDIPLYILDLTKMKDFDKYNIIIDYCKILIDKSKEQNILIEDLIQYVKSLYSKFNILSLQNWNVLSFSDFIKIINNLEETKLPINDEIRWMKLFNDYKQKLLFLEEQIKATDKEIDQMVYKLYGLTDEEIAIVEG